jgi:hypothetical protein
MSQIRMDKTGASLTGGEGIDIFPVVEKTDLRRSRVVQRGDIPDPAWFAPYFGMATTKLGSFLVRYSITTRVTSSEFSTTTAWSFERWCRLSNCVAVALLDRDLGPPWPAAEALLRKMIMEKGHSTTGEGMKLARKGTG